MSKITGRPPKAIKQEKFVGYFVTNVQYEVIRRKAEEAKVNISDYMRQVAVNGSVNLRWTEAEVEMLKKMVELSNDLHQLIGMAEREGVVSAMLFFTRYRDAIDQIIKQLGNDR